MIDTTQDQIDDLREIIGAYLQGSDGARILSTVVSMMVVDVAQVIRERAKAQGARMVSVSDTETADIARFHSTRLIRELQDDDDPIARIAIRNLETLEKNLSRPKFRSQFAFAVTLTLDAGAYIPKVA